MIGYPISRSELEEKIEAHKPGWLANAKQRTDGFRRRKRYAEKSSIWSQIKAVYMALQGLSKCAYCERKLESVTYGKGEQDVEHFRPKASVRAWKPSKALQKNGVSVTPVPAGKNGYYLLPYHPFNYAAACKPCNSALKRDYFPITGKYKLTGADPGKLIKEEPLLIYPLGDIDVDPEDLIGFYGVSPQAHSKDGNSARRALVTIEFFKLDDATKRKNLLRERAIIIMALYPQLKALTDGTPGPNRDQAREIVEGFTASIAPHASCARSFRLLFGRNHSDAKAEFDRASRFVASGS